jgi:hypothetical protein
MLMAVVVPIGAATTSGRRPARSTLTARPTAAGPRGEDPL